MRFSRRAAQARGVDTQKHRMSALTLALILTLALTLTLTLALTLTLTLALTLTLTLILTLGVVLVELTPSLESFCSGV